MQTTKLSLSCSNDKQCILPNGVDTLPFEHYSLQEVAMFREVSGDTEWGNDVLREKRKTEEDIHPTRTNNTELPIFSPPDPGFFQNPISDDEVFDLINLVELSDTELDPQTTEPDMF